MLKPVWIKNLGITLLLISGVWLLEAILYREIFTTDRPLKDMILFRGNLYALHVHILFSMTLLALGIVLSLKSLKYKRTQQELIKQQENYRLLTENSNDVIWKLSIDGKFLYVSPSVEKLRGYSPVEVMEQTLEEVLTPASQKTINELMYGLEEVIRANPGKTASVITELEQPCKDGSAVWTEASVQTVLDPFGKPDYFIGVSRDITERKQNERELKRSEEYYRLIAETTMDYIFVHDLEGRIIFANPSGLKASGYSLQELMGEKIVKFVPEEYHPLLDEMSSKNIGEGLETCNYEVEFYTREGERRPLELSTAPILINRTPISILVAARDISDRKKAEEHNRLIQEKIRRINVELEEKVRDRTRKLEQANKDLESFSYSVSHDLHAPLRHISTFSDLLKKSLTKGETEKTSNYLDAIISSVSKMKDLINGLLQLSQTGRSDLRKEQFEMKLIVEQVIRDVEIDYPDKKICWKLNELGEADADIRLMKQVWYNLVSNAVKFTNGKAKAEIEIGKKILDERTVWYIKDNGVGFDTKNMDKLFGVFQRLHSEEDFEGNGIGLATVDRIINKHEGRIWAEANPDQGAVFYFYL